MNWKKFSWKSSKEMGMAANIELQKIKEWEGLRGFSNLFHKENGAWWGTRRWWINFLLWTLLVCGLTAFMLFIPNEEVYEASEAEIAQAGGLVAYILTLGLSVFFEFGITTLAIWTVVLTQDMIIGEKQSGVAEWLLSKPVVRRAYVLAKLSANTLPMLVLFVGLPSIMVYSMLSLRMGSLYPLMPFLSAVGLMSLNTFFYLTFTLMLGTIFNNRAPILGIALASVLGGGMLGGFVSQLLYVTPWILPKAAWLISTGQTLPTGIVAASLSATALWCGVFIFVALVKLEKMEF
jgi:ABC-2 type transport system permease protein